jgi:hypothetical protein
VVEALVLVARHLGQDEGLLRPEVDGASLGALTAGTPGKWRITFLKQTQDGIEDLGFHINFRKH